MPPGIPTGRLRNWNNQSAHGFMHSDDRPVRLGAPGGERSTSGRTGPSSPTWCGVMNRAGDRGHALDRAGPWSARCWPVPTPRQPWPARPSRLLDRWVADDAPLLDADEDGEYDHAGAALFEQLWPSIERAVLDPVFGDLLDAGVELPRDRHGQHRGQGPAHRGRRRRGGTVPALLLRPRRPRRLPARPVDGDRPEDGRAPHRARLATRRPGGHRPAGPRSSPA